MTKIPYTYGQLLSTISPAAPIAIYADGKKELDELYKGTAIKSRDRADLLPLEVKHIGVNEQNRAKEDHFLLEIFLYDNGENGHN